MSSSQQPTTTSSTSSTLLPPRLMARATTSDSIECSVHTLPKPLLREFQHVFGDKYLHFEESSSSDGPLELLAIPTNQHAREDLVAVGDHIEKEKDRLLNVFIDFAKDFTTQVRSQHFWADFIDPCSGLPMLTPNCNKVFSECDAHEVLLNYRTYNAGFCKILTHPSWGSSVYPATIFCYAPRNHILQLMQEKYPTVQEKP